MIEAPITLLLSRAQQGDRNAERQVIPLVYGRLRLIARSLMRAERPQHTLQATALVGELFVQKLRRIPAEFSDREQFFSLAAYGMRQVLIDHARRKSAGRRYSPDAVANLLVMAGPQDPMAEDRLAVRQVFQALARIDGTAAQCIRFRFLDGLTISQTAEAVRRPAWKVRADSDFGLRWMARQLRTNADAPVS